jgi:hypothetical protein
VQRLERAAGEVLRLVDDEQDPLAAAVARAEVVLDQAEHARLRRRGRVERQRLRHEPRHVVGAQAERADQGDEQPLVAQLLAQVSYQRRLAGADLAGDDDEALALLKPEGEVGHGPAVRAAGVEEARARAELERPSREGVVFRVHRGGPQGRVAAVAAFRAGGAGRACRQASRPASEGEATGATVVRTGIDVAVLGTGRGRREDAGHPCQVATAAGPPQAGGLSRLSGGADASGTSTEPCDGWLSPAATVVSSNS